MRIKADFHAHTTYSPDSGMSPAQLVEAARKAGLGAIAVTDHNTTAGAKEAKRIANGSLLVIVGQEVRTLAGEVIVLGLENDLPKKRPPLETCKAAKKAGGFIIIPHMFDRTRKGMGMEAANILEYIGAVEVLNSRCLLSGPNRKAEAFAQEHGLPMTSGSDAHFPGEIGSCWTEVTVSGRLTPKSLLNALRSGHVCGSRTGIWPHLRTLRHNLKRSR